MSKKPKCRVCKTPFERVYTSLQKTCSVPCALKDAENTRIANSKRVERENRKKTRLAKERLKTRSDWLKSAQTACNAYIRERDKHERCISCGRSDGEINGYLTGGKWDSGHFKSRGGFPELRFHPLNVHKQCKSCNGGSNKYARKDRVVSGEYRERLVRKIGLQMVEWLEGSHEAQNWTIDDIKEIDQYYKEQLKLLKHG